MSTNKLQSPSRISPLLCALVPVLNGCQTRNGLCPHDPEGPIKVASMLEPFDRLRGAFEAKVAGCHSAVRSIRKCRNDPALGPFDGKGLRTILLGRPKSNIANHSVAVPIGPGNQYL